MGDWYSTQVKFMATICYNESTSSANLLTKSDTFYTQWGDVNTAKWCSVSRKQYTMLAIKVQCLEKQYKYNRTIIWTNEKNYIDLQNKYRVLEKSLTRISTIQKEESMPPQYFTDEDELAEETHWIRNKNRQKRNGLIPNKVQRSPKKVSQKLKRTLNRHL